MPEMTFASPAALALGLTVPVVVLLWVLRPRRPRRRVPSLMLWPRSSAERQAARPWQRLRNHPLLWLQVAAALLLALTAAGPYLPGSETAAHVVVLLDASGSMRATDTSSDRFTLAKGAVRDIARSLGAGQELTLIRLDEAPRALVAGATGARQVEAALADESPSFGPADFSAGLALAEGLTHGPSEWVLVSDGGLALGEGAYRPAGTSFRFIQVGASAKNVALTGLAARVGADDLTLQVGLKGYTTESVAGEVQLFAEGELVGARAWRLEPSGEAALTWSHLPLGPRWYEARLTGVPPETNALAADDRAWVAGPAPTEPAVLLVSAGNSFLERALAAHGGLRPYRISPEDWPEIAAEAERYSLVIFDRVWPSALPKAHALYVGPPAGEEFRPAEIFPRPDHPLLRHVDWSEVRIGAARRVPLDATWETVVESADGALLAVREAGGRREAILAFELGQSDLPLRPAFPILIANLFDWLLPRPDVEARAVPPGGSVALATSPLAASVVVEPVEATGAANTSAVLAPPFPARPFHPPAPGVYRVVQSGEDGDQESLLLAEGYLDAEADLTPRAIDLPAADGAPAAPAQSALLLWPFLAGGVILLSIVEWWVDARGR